MRLTDITAPLAEPVTLESVRLFLRIDHTDEDNLLGNFIRAVRQHIEAQINSSLITRPQTLSRPVPRGPVIYLNNYPVNSIEAVRIETTSETITINDFTANLRARPTPIRLISGTDWSAAYPNALAMEVDFTAGYGLAPEDVPMPIRQALYLLIAHFYEHRGDAPAPVPMMVDALLMPYRGLRL